MNVEITLKETFV
ncbi:hypothetical protein D039_4284A, partial [Vibrio parahaemolyticus EKP-028]